MSPVCTLEGQVLLHRLVVFAVAIVPAAVSCTGTSPGPRVVALQRDLQQEYPGGQFTISFIPGQHHLVVTVDTAVYGNYRLDDSQRRALGERMARSVVKHYEAAAGLDSITVQFVQERSGDLIAKSWNMLEEEFALAGLHQPT